MSTLTYAGTTVAVDPEGFLLDLARRSAPSLRRPSGVPIFCGLAGGGQIIFT